MLITRPVWVLPNNDIAMYPFDTKNPTNVKGLLFEARATFEPVPQTYAGSRGGGVASGLARKVNIIRPDINIRPASVAITQRTNGRVKDGDISTNTVIDRVVTANSYIFIKKPTLLAVPPSGGSTETDDVTNPNITVNITNAWWSGSGDHWLELGFYYTDDLDTFFSIYSWALSPNVPFGTTWETLGFDVPVEKGKKIVFAFLSREYHSYTHEWKETYTILTDEYYVCPQMELNLDMNEFFDPEDFTTTFQGDSVKKPSAFTTVDVPSWVFAPDIMRTREGVQGFIEYSAPLALLGVEYNDYTPWEHF